MIDTINHIVKTNSYEQGDILMLRMIKVIGRGIKRLIQLIILTITLFVGILLLINLFTIATTYQSMLSIEELVDSEFIADDVPVIVLGAGVVDNVEPSQILKQRLDQAAAVFEVAPGKPFIMSGDHRDQYYNEVSVMKDYLIEQGLPSNQIFLDHAGYSTYDSLYRLKHVIGEDRVIIVTQGYHLSRALMLARGLGIDAVGVPAADSKSSRLYREVREIFARVKDFAVTYLGYQEESRPNLDEAFNLEMTGDQTNDKLNLLE